MEEKHYASAAQCLEVALLVSPDEARDWYQLALAHAASGKKRPALSALKSALARGFRDASTLENEPLLESIPQERSFMQLTESIRH